VKVRASGVNPFGPVPISSTGCAIVNIKASHERTRKHLMKDADGKSNVNGRGSVQLLRRSFWRLGVLTFLWWVLTEGSSDAWKFGLPVVILASLTTLTLRSGFNWRCRPIGMIRFLPFFFRQSLSGGIDVARRALSPRMPLAPLLVDYPLRLPKGPARVFLADTVSLLPGTCSVSLEDGCLRIHVLDGSLPVYQALQTVEERVAELFDVEMPPAALKEEIADIE